MSPLIPLAALGAGAYLLLSKKSAAGNTVRASSGREWIVEAIPKGSAMDTYFQLPADTRAFQLSAPAGAFGPHQQAVVLIYTQKGSDMGSRKIVQKTAGLPDAMAAAAITDFGLAL